MNYFYGGAFNPITLAHLSIIKSILNVLNENDSLYLAITDHEYKQYQFDKELRKEIVLENIKNFNTNKIKVIYQTDRTWNFLKDWNNVILVLGEDEYNDLKSLKIWKNSELILQNFQFKIFSRSNETKDISATKVRELINNNEKDFEVFKKYITKETYNILKKYNYI